MNMIAHGFLSLAAALVCSIALAQGLPPIFEGVPEKLLQDGPRIELPKNTFLENLIVDGRGRMFVTSHEEGVVYQRSGDKTLKQFVKVDGKVAGIAAGPGDSLVVSGADKSGAPVVYHIGSDGKLKQAIPVPGGMFLNGVERIGKTHFLIADSYNGCIWHLDTATAKVSRWLAHPLLARADEKSPFPAVNGIRKNGERMLVSNTAKQLLIEIPIAKGRAGTPKILRERVNIDDFAVDVNGDIYAATHVYNSVIRLPAKGELSVVANASQGMVGSTAVAIHKLKAGERAIYVTTNGGMFLPPPEGVQSGKLVQLKLPRL